MLLHYLLRREGSSVFSVTKLGVYFTWSVLCCVCTHTKLKRIIDPDQIKGSGALAALLCEVLAVGNTMNEGTKKGDARAITVDSLLTLTKTKSHCKSMTVLDYIAESLLTKDASGIISSSTTYYTESAPPPASYSSFPKTGREMLGFAAELPDLDAASRLPIVELCQQAQQLRSALQGAKRELSALQAEASGENEATAVEAGGGAPTARLATRLSPSARQENPRAALMAMFQKRNDGTGGSNGLSEAMKVQRRDKERVMKQGHGVEEGKIRSDEECGKKGEIARQPTLEAAAVVSSLDDFVDRASCRLGALSRAEDEVRAAASRMAAFLGDRSQDAGYIFACLKQFAELTGAARDRHDKRVEDLARKARIAARQQQEQYRKVGSGGTDCCLRGMNVKATTGSFTTSATERRQQRSIDPKAGLMEEVRLRYTHQKKSSREFAASKNAEKLAFVSPEAKEDVEFGP